MEITPLLHVFTMVGLLITLFGYFSCKKDNKRAIIVEEKFNVFIT